MHPLDKKTVALGIKIDLKPLDLLIFNVLYPIQSKSIAYPAVADKSILQRR
jgi:hypothetical protein